MARVSPFFRPVKLIVAVRRAPWMGARVSSLAPETQKLIARMQVQPDAARATVIDNLVAALKGGGLWGKFDFLFVLGAHDAQAARLNWISPASPALQPIANPVFTVDRGYTGNGTSAALDTGLWLFLLRKCLQNDAHLGGWARVAGTGGKFLIALEQFTTFEMRNFQNVANERYTNVNAAAGLSVNDDITTGHVVGVRRDAATQWSYRNGAGEASLASASVPLANRKIMLLQRGSSFSDAQILFAHVGSQLSAAEVLALYNALNAYKTAIGA